jgi:serine/threonine protein kinase
VPPLCLTARQVFRPAIAADAVDFVGRLLVYTPQRRLTAFQALAHPFFDDLRDPLRRLPNTNPLPPLFDLNEKGACLPAWLPGAAVLTGAELEVLPPALVAQLRQRPVSGAGTEAAVEPPLPA